jgi:hypothetical protein
MVRVAEAGLYTSVSATAPALESGASGSLRVRVPKKKSLELSGSIPSTVLAPKCAKTFSLQVKNTGDVDEEVEFVGDKLSGIQLRSETKIIPAGGAEDVQFTVETGDSSSGKATGTVRLKYTNKGMALDFPLAEAPKLEVSPTDVTCRELLCNYVVTIKNNGKSTVSDITATPRGSEALTSKMRFEGITAPLVTKALPPGQDVKFALVVEGTEGGSYTAFLDVEATCFAKSISVKSERK